MQRSGNGRGGRQSVVAQVWVKVTPAGDPHPKAAELMDTIKKQFPDAEVRIDREQGYYDRALLRVLYANGAKATQVGQAVQELIREFRGGGDANLLTGKVFTLRVPVGPKGEITNPRAQAVLDDIKHQYPKAEVEQHNEGNVGTVDIYMRDISDAERFMGAYRAIRDIVKRHKGESAGKPAPNDE